MNEGLASKLKGTRREELVGWRAVSLDVHWALLSSRTFISASPSVSNPERGATLSVQNSSVSPHDRAQHLKTFQHNTCSGYKLWQILESTKKIKIICFHSLEIITSNTLVYFHTHMIHVCFSRTGAWHIVSCPRPLVQQDWIFSKYFLMLLYFFQKCTL